MIDLHTLRAERRDEILRIAGRRGAHSLRVFGSVARGEASENSDLDLLVAWEPGRSLLDHVALVQDLQELLGMKVKTQAAAAAHMVEIEARRRGVEGSRRVVSVSGPICFESRMQLLEPEFARCGAGWRPTFHVPECLGGVRAEGSYC